MSLTSEQLRAARAMLRLDQIPLAENSGVSVESIRRFEKMDGEIKAHETTVASLRLALERSGVVFLDDKEGTPRGGPGVRLTEKTDADQWNAQVGTILDALVESLEIAVEERGMQSDEMTAAILEARREAYDLLERDIRDANTPDMIDALQRPGESRNAWLGRIEREGFPAPKSQRPNAPRRVSETDMIKLTSGDGESE